MTDEEGFEDQRSSRRRTTDYGPFAGMPWQVKALGIFGAPTLIACYLVWLLGNTMLASVVSTQRLVVEHVGQQTAQTQAMASQAQAQATMLGSLERQNDEVIRILRTACVNDAKDNGSRERCLR